MTSEEWLNLNYEKYPEEIEGINKHRKDVWFTEDNGKISGSFRFGSEIYGTIYVAYFGTKEELKKEYLDRNVNLAYELFEEKMLNFQLKRMKEDIEFFFNSLFRVQYKNEGICTINEVTYLPKINFCGSSYTISRYKKDPQTGNEIGVHTVDDIIKEIKNNYYNKFALRSGYKLQAAFCQLLDFLNKNDETE